MVTLPKKSTFPDAEQVVCDYVDEMLKPVTPEIKAYTYLPNMTTSDLDDGKAFVLVQRVGGIANYSQRAVDMAIIELTVVAATRMDSWEVLGYLRDCFYEAASGVEAGGSRIVSVKETSGPSEMMFADPKQRAVKFLFQIGIRRKTRRI